MRDKQKGKWVFTCDTCNEVLETNAKDRELANAKREEEGWKAYYDGREWTHSCAECS